MLGSAAVIKVSVVLEVVKAVLVVASVILVVETEAHIVVK